MATDARGHTVPTGSDFAQRKSLTDLSLSIPSIKSVASEAAATLYLATLSDAGITPSVANPVWVWRSDLTRLLINDGSAWRVVAGTIAGHRVMSTAQTFATGTIGRYTVTADGGDETWSIGVTMSGAGIAVPVAGVYHVEGSIKWSGNATGRRIIALWKGSTMLQKTVTTAPAGAQNSADMAISDIVKMSAGEEILVGGRQDSGGNLTITGGTLGVAFMGPA